MPPAGARAQRQDRQDVGDEAIERLIAQARNRPSPHLSDLSLAGLVPAIEMSSTNPSRIIGLGKRGLLVPGYEADIIVFDNDFRVLASMVGGRFLKNEL